MLRPTRIIPMMAVVLVAALAVAGCGNKANDNAAGGSDTSSTGMTSDTSSMGGMTAGSSTMEAPASDAEIAAILKTANDADIEDGRTAEGKSRNADVKTFARQMINDHGAGNKNVDALMKKLDLAIQESRTSNDLKAMADAKRDSLKQLEGAAFDRAYIDAMVAVHQMLLNDLDGTLIPGAKSDDMRQLLQETRSVVANHLRMAQDIQSKLGATSAR
jgi:putative membrane protein